MDIAKEILIGEGHVLHSRPGRFDEPGRHGKIVENSFRYPIFNFLIPIKESTPAEIKNGFLSVSSKNYLEGNGGSFYDNIRYFLKEKAQYSCDEIWLQTLPKMFGYIFNPVSFWFCYVQGELDAVLCEVNNTFGDRHFYFVNHLEGEKKVTRELKKEFHVSPFFDIEGEYLFTFQKTAQESDVRIQLFRGEKLDLNTRIHLHLAPLKETTPFQIFCNYGWMTAMVIGRIHWQALKLWWKGATFYTRPEPPQEVTTKPAAQASNK